MESGTSLCAGRSFRRHYSTRKSAEGYQIAGVASSTDPLVEGGNDPVELPRSKIKGFRTGDYVRLEVKLKRNSWHMKLLNTGDQIIVSAGWRRYVTTPTYAMENSNNGHHRILKYTPEHKHCLATFWGPLSSPNTRIAAVRSVPDNKEEFRITAKGVVLDFDFARKIVKKTTRRGTPYQIFKNTAFVKFTPGAETGTVTGAPIHTVSGIRVKVKEAVNGREIVRCTFKHKIRRSDVVLLRVFTPVDVPHLINLFTATLGSRDLIVPNKTDPRKMDYHGQRWQVHKQRRRRVLIKERGPVFLTSSNPLELIYWHERQMGRMKRKETHESKGEEEKKDVEENQEEKSVRVSL
ncbi:hypothetical protein C5167_024218 [Papaver somniferum]|uniref:Ribosome biogenesis protein BMS1/TSR1 C-terminal domain-containing protein n=1 Tax=Papaver somniferum TaxID=3469 RepID=A0A4Y7JRY4_PAPSO|nr:hypothetical protein C5167_024218 [Papaver somniferum]